MGMPEVWAMVARACWAGATCAGALQPSRALVLLRQVQEVAPVASVQR